VQGVKDKLSESIISKASGKSSFPGLEKPAQQKSGRILIRIKRINNNVIAA